MKRNDIVGFYKDYMLIEKDGTWLVVRRTAKQILYKGDELQATRIFIMYTACSIDEELESKFDPDKRIRV